MSWEYENLTAQPVRLTAYGKPDITVPASGSVELEFWQRIWYMRSLRDAVMQQKLLPLGSGGGSGGGTPDGQTIDYNTAQELHLKDADTYVRTTGAQSLAGVKTFSNTDVHSAGISVTGTASKLTLQASASSTTAGDAVKVSMGNNVSGVAAGAGGDLSLVLYGSGTAVGDYGAGVTSNALNLKAGAGVINHFIGNKNVASMGANGTTNLVLTTQTGGTTPVTATTELGIKAFCNSGTNRGFEFRLSATLLWQFVCDTNNFHYRKSSDNGATWGAWYANCTAENTAWV